MPPLGTIIFPVAYCLCCLLESWSFAAPNLDVALRGKGCRLALEGEAAGCRLMPVRDAGTPYPGGPCLF